MLSGAGRGCVCGYRCLQKSSVSWALRLARMSLCPFLFVTFGLAACTLQKSKPRHYNTRLRLRVRAPLFSGRARVFLFFACAEPEKIVSVFAKAAGHAIAVWCCAMLCVSIIHLLGQKPCCWIKTKLSLSHALRSVQRFSHLSLRRVSRGPTTLFFLLILWFPWPIAYFIDSVMAVLYPRARQLSRVCLPVLTSVAPLVLQQQCCTHL